MALSIGLIILSASVSRSGEPLSAGGSNYITVDSDPKQLQATPDAWKNSSIFKSPICQYRHESAAVTRDLVTLFTNGQRRLALVLWHARLDGTPDCAGYLFNSRTGRFSSEVMYGLNSVLDAASAIGFWEVHLRFAPMWINDPAHWSAWNPEFYQENVGVIRQVYDLVKNKKIKVVIDLGLELGGLTDSETLAKYVAEIWDSFCGFGTGQISFINSVAASPGRVSRYLRWLKGSSCCPSPLYLDVYSRGKSQVQMAAEEARQSGIEHPQFVIEETYYADSDEFGDLTSAASSSNVDLMYVMQWPITRASEKSIVALTPIYIYGPH